MDLCEIFVDDSVDWLNAGKWHFITYWDTNGYVHTFVTKNNPDGFRNLFGDMDKISFHPGYQHQISFDPQNIRLVEIHLFRFSKRGICCNIDVLNNTLEFTKTKKIFPLNKCNNIVDMCNNLRILHLEEYKTDDLNDLDIIGIIKFFDSLSLLRSLAFALNISDNTSDEIVIDI